MDNLAGQYLGQYKVIHLIGEGGMAAIYQARQESMKRDVAIKVIKTSLLGWEDFVQRFEREAQTVASLSHAHILKVFEYGQHEDTVYLVMELLTGGSLEQLITKGPLSLAQSSSLLDQIASALDYAHQKGIIHRDLKPGNVLMDDSVSAFLTDFGLAKLLNTSQKLTQAGTSIGTPAYMAPEQWRAEPLDARTDVYALGVLLFEMLAGALPFNGDSALSMMYLHMHEPPPALRTLKPEIPGAVQNVVEKALNKEPQQRFESAGQLAAAFRAALQGKQPTQTSQTTSTNPYGQPLLIENKRSIRWLWAGLGVVAVLVVITLGAIAASRLQPTPVIPTVAQLAAAASNTPTSTTDLSVFVAQTLSAQGTSTANAVASFTATFTPTSRPTLTPTNPPTSTPTTPPPPTNAPLPPTASAGPRPGGPPPGGGSYPEVSSPRIFAGHTASVNSIAFALDGKSIASGSDDKTARLWDIATSKSIHVFAGHSGAVKSVAISPDGQTLLTGSADNTAISWDIQSGQQVRTFSGHTGSVNKVAFTPDGSQMLTASDDKTAKLWDVQTGALVRTFEGAHSLGILAAAFSPDGSLIATGSADKTVLIWNVECGAAVQTIKVHTGAVQAVAFSQNGTLLVSGSADGTARIWNVQKGTSLHILDNHKQSVFAVVFSPNGMDVLTAGQGGVAIAWNQNNAPGIYD